jgi:hypothetical protein
VSQHHRWSYLPAERFHSDDRWSTSYRESHTKKNRATKEIRFSLHITNNNQQISNCTSSTFYKIQQSASLQFLAPPPLCRTGARNKFHTVAHHFVVYMGEPRILQPPWACHLRLKFVAGVRVLSLLIPTIFPCAFISFPATFIQSSTILFVPVY